MPVDAKLSHTAAMILQAIHAGHIYGFSVMQMTGLPSGTVYPAMRRLERDGLVGRRVYPEVPPRVEYRLTESARSLIPILVQLDHWALETAKQRNP